VIVRILLGCLIALCLVGSTVQASDLTTVDEAAELELVPHGMIAPEPIDVIAPIRTPIACELPAAAIHISRLHVTDAFRPPQA